MSRNRARAVSSPSPKRLVGNVLGFAQALRGWRPNRVGWRDMNLGHGARARDRQSPIRRVRRPLRALWPLWRAAVACLLVALAACDAGPAGAPAATQAPSEYLD